MCASVCASDISVSLFFIYVNKRNGVWWRGEFFGHKVSAILTTSNNTTFAGLQQQLFYILTSISFRCNNNTSIILITILIIIITIKIVILKPKVIETVSSVIITCSITYPYNCTLSSFYAFFSQPTIPLYRWMDICWIFSTEHWLCQLCLLSRCFCWISIYIKPKFEAG